MGALNIDEIKKSNDEREEVVKWCIQATKEFYDVAKQLDTKD